MADLNFPSSPSDGQQYNLNGVYYTYNSGVGAWLTTYLTKSVNVANTQIYFNDSGISNGSFGLVFNKGSNTFSTSNIIASGNVAIGRTTADYKLDVNGTVNAAAILVNGVAVGGGSITVDLTPANSYTNTSTAAANNYAGFMANAANAIASATYATQSSLSTGLISANNYAGVMANSGNAWTNAYATFIGTTANNYAGVMANSVNAFTSATYATSTNATAAFAKANSALANTTGTFAGTLTVTGAIATSNVILNNNGYVYWGAGDGSTYIQANSVSETLKIGTTGSDRITVTSTGNVGIGITNPLAELHVQQSVDGEIVRFQRGGGTNLPILRFNLTESTALAEIEQTGAVAGNIAFRLAGSERARFDTDGRFLVNTTSPANSSASKILVGGDLTLVGTNRTLGGNLYYDNTWRYAGTGFGWGFRENNSGLLQLMAAPSGTSGANATVTYPVTFNLATGDVGIGTTNPLDRLDVLVSSTSNTYNDIVMFRQSNDSAGSTYSRMLFSQVTANNMMIEVGNQSNDKGNLLLHPYGGNVGIGRTTANYRLDVNGSVNAAAVLVNGSPITVDLTPANSYTNTSTTAANNYLGGLANTGFSTQSMTVTSLSDSSGTISWDASTSRMATVTLSGTGRTVSNPTNLRAGSYVLVVKQDAGGSKTITSWGNAFKWPAAVAPTLSTTASTTDVFSFWCDGTNLFGTFIPDCR